VLWRGRLPIDAIICATHGFPIRLGIAMALALFSRNREREVQSFVLNLINNRCPALSFGGDDLRIESRVNLTVVVLVMPIEKGRPQVDRCVAAVSSDFSTTGLSLVVRDPQDWDEVVLGIPRRHSVTFLRAKAKHANPMGAGFHRLGFKLLEVLPLNKYPELEGIAQQLQQEDF
jgi:hypothetical protein